MKKVITVIFLWLCWGFALGTLLLLGPTRWLVNYEREKEMPVTTENTTVIILIIFLAIASFAVAYYSAKSILNPATGARKRRALSGIPLIAALFAVYIFFHPDWINSDRENKFNSLNTSFSTGSYPELDKMEELKRKGFTAVVSLLHPAVVPFEPVLLEKEKKNAAEAGLEFISIPFLPWVSENENSIDSLRSLIKKGQGKYYVHCYLGLDRIAAASRIINQEGKTMIHFDRGKKDSLILKKKFERGNVVEIEKDVFLGPQLTKEEYFFVIGNFRQVAALRNLKDPEIKIHVEEEEKWLQPFKIPIQIFEVNGQTSATEMQKIVNAVKSLPKPLFIHGFFTDDKEIILFEDTYRKSLN
ncbi:MAG: hypothetical protein WKF85_10205 [Chitinophagaceae bacterium]